MDLLVAFAAAMSVTMALIPLLQRFAARLQVLDHPGSRKVHARPIPRVGGLAMAAGMLVPAVLWLRHDPGLMPFLTGALLLLAMGVWDDRAELGPVAKFATQLVAALVIVVWGDVAIHSVTLTDRIELPRIVAVPLTVLFIVGVTNAINLSDGLDGLAGGTTLLCCCAVGLLALSSGLPFVPTVAVILAGSILGFLRYNTYPASVFMGDGGSQLLGFSVATLSVMLTQSSLAPVSSALPLLLLGLPILDTLTVMLQRLREGRSPFAADKNHLHHKLLGLRFDHHEAVFVIYEVQALLFLAAWFMRYESDLMILLLYAAFAAMALGALVVAERRGWKVRHAAVAQAAALSPLARWIVWLREPRRLPAWSVAVAGAGGLLYALAVALLARDVPADVAILAGGLAVLLGLSVAVRDPPTIVTWMQQAAVYVAIVAIVFLDFRAPVAGPAAGVAVGTYFALLAGCIIVAFRTDLARRFQITPLDLLVIFVALALPTLPGAVVGARSLGLSALILLVLFYAAELCFNRSAFLRRAVLLGCCLALGLVAIRSVPA
jgi:UDP-GlcNAc:undecaprenyl-phosphate GlcNAc-1-phosphate transferase